MIKNFVKILELLGDRLEVCVSVYFAEFKISFTLINYIFDKSSPTFVSLQKEHF